VFKEHEQIVLTAEVLGDEGEALKPGDVGTIIHLHRDKAAFVVEFMSLDGATVDIATVLPSHARPVNGADLTHARTIAAAI
jgi:hypothetical protein